MTLLIADDDLQIRSGLQMGIDWASLGFDAVHAAADGLEALRLFEAHQPDVVITDIRMPGLDGIELSRAIRERSETVGIIVLSGYSDFEYARGAIRSGVTDYLLKPVRIPELIRQVTEAAERSVRAKAETQDRSRREAVLRERLLEEMIRGDRQDPGDLAAALERHWGVSASVPLRAVIVAIDHAWRLSAIPDRTLLLSERGMQAAQRIDEESVASVRQEDRLVLVTRPKAGVGADAFRYRLQDACRWLNAQPDAPTTVTLAAGRAVPAVEISRSIREAEAGLANRLHAGPAGAHPYDPGQAAVGLSGQAAGGDMVPAPRDGTVPPSDTWKELTDRVQAIFTFDREEVGRRIRAFYAALRGMRLTDAEQAQRLLDMLEQRLAAEVKAAGIDYEGLFARNVSLFSRRGELECLQDQEAWICDLYDVVLTALTDMKGLRTSPAVRRAVAAIHQRYAEDLTVEEMAEAVRKSPNYFSHLFRKEMGVTFSEYLNRIRIREAARMLRTGDLLAYEVAQRVGFRDYKYFTQVFRRIEGCSPSDCRKAR